MKTALTVVLILLLFQVVFAQRKSLTLDFTGSPGFYQLKPVNGFNHQYSERRGYGTGVGLSYFLTDKTFLSTGLFYNRIGYTVSYAYLTLQPMDPLVPVKSDVRSNYIEVPLVVNHCVLQSDATKVYLNAGAVASFRVSTSDYTTFQNGDVRSSGYLRSQLISFRLGLGIRQALNEKLGLLLEPNYRIFTSGIDKIMDQSASSVNATVGISYRLR